MNKEICRKMFKEDQEEFVEILEERKDWYSMPKFLRISLVIGMYAVAVFVTWKFGLSVGQSLYLVLN